MSSVAIVLLIASLAAAGVIAPAASLALVLGANLGGTLPPLFEAGTGTARRLPLGNLLVRGAGCIVALPLLAVMPGCYRILNPPRHASSSIFTPPSTWRLRCCFCLSPIVSRRF